MADIRARLEEMTNAASIMQNLYTEIETTRNVVNSIIGEEALNSAWSGNSFEAFEREAVTKVLAQFNEMMGNITKCSNSLANVIETYRVTEEANMSQITKATEGFQQPTYDTI